MKRPGLSSVLRAARRAVPVLLGTLLVAAPAAAQTPAKLTLADALRLAAEHSEALAVARAGEARADADLMRARSGALPQVSFTGGYDRTLASQYSDFSSDSGGAVTPCPVFAPNPTQPLESRVAEIERAADCGGIGGGLGGINFSSLPFGQANIYQYGLSFSQALYTGGRVTAQRNIARSSRESASLDDNRRRDPARTGCHARRSTTPRWATVSWPSPSPACSRRPPRSSRRSFPSRPAASRSSSSCARRSPGQPAPVLIRRNADRDIAYLRLRQLLELPRRTRRSCSTSTSTAHAAAAARRSPRHSRSSIATTTPADRDRREAGRDRRPPARGRRRGRAAERLPSVALTSSLAGSGYPSTARSRASATSAPTGRWARPCRCRSSPAAAARRGAGRARRTRAGAGPAQADP